MTEDFIDFVKASSNFLDEKKPQTTYKIKYIFSYVEKWLYVVCNVTENKNINFIDCMCNAGIYADGDYGTGIKVLELFNEFATKHLDKIFNLVLNDFDMDRLQIIKDVVNKYVGIKSSNIHIYYFKKDVNDFLLDDKYFTSIFNCYPNRSANLVFVDPYNFCTVKLSTLQQFLSDKYCELLFNVFTSDFVRNQDKAKMTRYCQDEGITVKTKPQMVELIKDRLNVGHVKYTFSYEFKTITNNELYQIMFFTPNLRGLEKLKEALWETFNGKEFHRNEKESDYEQLSMFTEDWMIEQHSFVAKQLVLSSLLGQILDYEQLESFIIENTILNCNQIIDNVIKPLIENNQVQKMCQVSNKNNYKNDKYKILG